MKIKNAVLCPYCGAQPEPIDALTLIKEMLEHTPKLFHKIDSLLDFYKKQKILTDDDKMQSILSFIMLVQSVHTQLGLYIQHGRELEKIQSEKPLEEHQSVISTFHHMDSLAKKNFLIEFLFQTQGFLKSVNKILPKTFDDSKYESLMKNILKELKISEKNEEGYRIMKFPANIRNCLHNKGMFTDDNEGGKIDGINFSFKKGENVEYLSWRHMYFFIDHMLDIIEQISKHDLVKEKYVKSNLPNRYYEDE